VQAILGLDEGGLGAGVAANEVVRPSNIEGNSIHLKGLWIDPLEGIESVESSRRIHCVEIGI